MPLQHLLIVAVAAVLAIYGHPMVIVVGTVVLLAASLVVLARLAPDAAKLNSPPVQPPGWVGGGRLIDEAGAERVSQLTAYSLTLFFGSAGLFLALWWMGAALAILAIAGIWIVAWWPSTMRTHNLTTNIDIKRQPADVFAFVSDQRNLLRYWPYHESVEMLTPDPIVRGSQFRARVRLPRSLFNNKEDDLFEAVEEIVGFEPPLRIATRLITGLRPNLAVITFDPTPTGTLLTHSFTMEFSYCTGLLGGMLLGGKGPRVSKATRAVAWARAKEILESETA
ncbi:MAG TPA: SRPBCC family protein [Candidatus Dormibacteraeota bacterium]|nr:SRPBCC family protein [Candidatus Dormibacteraeota bacterium]